MSDESDPDHNNVVERLVERLRGLAQEIGLDEVKARNIVEQVVTDMPLHTDGERLEWARNWMLAVASA